MLLRRVLIGAVLITPLLGESASAQSVTQTSQITSESAKEMINACETYAKQHDMALALWVVDQVNVPMRFKRMEGAEAVVPAENTTPIQSGYRNTISSRMSGFATPIKADGKVIGAFVIGGAKTAQKTACAQAALAAFKESGSARKPSISSEGAAQLAGVCEAWADERGLTGVGPGIWVLDAFGDPVYMSRTTPAPKLHVDTSRMKAETALNLTRPTSLLAKVGMSPASLMQLNAYPNSGGYPIIWKSQIIGAFAVGGIPPRAGQDPNDDCARAALERVFPESLTMDCDGPAGCLKGQIGPEKITK